MQHGETADVIVIGGGPAGSAAALRLAQAKLHVIQLERRVWGDGMSHTLRSGEGIIPRTRRELAALGIDTTAPWALAQIERVQMRWPNGTRTEDCIARHGGISMIDRERFDQHLFGHARRAGADGREGWQARSLCRDSAGRVEGVLAHDPDGALRRICAPIVIDAGGRHALAIREHKLRLIEPQGDFFAMSLFFDRCAGIRPGVWELHLFDQQTLTVVHLTQLAPGLVRCALGTSMQSKRDSACSPIDFFWQRLGKIPELRERLEDSVLLRRPWVCGAVGYRVRRTVFDGLLLIGDAAGYSNPLFGDGIYRALRSAHSAAHTVAAALKRGAFTRQQLAPYMFYQAVLDRIGCCERRLVRAMYRHSYPLGTLGQQGLARNIMFSSLLA